MATRHLRSQVEKADTASHAGRERLDPDLKKERRKIAIPCSFKKSLAGDRIFPKEQSIRQQIRGFF